MPKPFTPKVVTANALIEGDVIYLTNSGEWSRRHEDARLFTEEAPAEAALSAAALQASEIVGAYLADAEATPKGPKPTHFREAFRATGPSNYAHGKQVDL
ncbi:DUF2849 domain-containing protein [Vannielia litorea]|uniref:DUF2849 domain-containing protein n=1 Tax=Vannielia TaxID=2813041 RepID=UPI001C963D82|nr:DUF2849 domain-containing protein [Vannielia litorea]MBY6047695.1 DUF2849 domain-containing protein [Vannielia litorea]MBY6075109.1 DUF2849 domain-containing protein [Vannielia litorea]MBY6152369.1 DUF2849 domain-containing protein [Vannielia litorea]